ncbi:MAG: cysteine desulfurase-like protein [Ilumatobacteraceae bacterium]
MVASIRDRFPGVSGPWARFDGPAGTQMVDVAIDAMAEWARSGSNANTSGAFPAADACDELLARARTTVGRLLGADPAGVCFGANMTTMTLALTRAVEQTLGPGDRVVGTRLDHDANVSPWRIACERSGADHVLAPFDPGTALLDPAAVVALIDERTRWVAVTGASNLIGTVPDLEPIIAAAHEVGARVFVDAVHLVPHRAVDVAALGCDVLATSPYKWYGPHAGVLAIDPELLEALPIAKVRPASDRSPGRFETGTPSFEAIAAVEAAAGFLIDEGLDSITTAEATLFRPLLDGLMAMSGVRVHGPPTMSDRTPTVAFTVEAHHPSEVAASLAAAQVAVWSGHSYAVEVVDQLGLAEAGGVVRAGISRYTERDDVDRLLAVVETITPPYPL